MNTQETHPKLWQRILNLLSHPAWNGLSCFFTALGTFGLGSIVVAYFLGFFKQAQDFFIWLLAPIEVPVVILLCGMVVILAFVSTAVYRNLSNKRQQRKQKDISLPPVNHSKVFEPSDLNIEILKQLAISKEVRKYWVEIGVIAAKNKLTENHADYLLRIMAKHGFVHQHMYDGTWNIKDKGVDFLIEHKYM